MARSDERKSDHQQGNVLDIGQPTSTNHVPSAETDERRRHERMERGADETVTSAQEEEPVYHRGSGVAGADMGISGEGTDVESPER